MSKFVFNEDMYGRKVKFLSDEAHMDMPEFYPAVGTVGTVVECYDNYEHRKDWKVQWPEGSTSGDDCWFCDEENVELIEEVDKQMTNEEIWEMLKHKMKKNNLLCENYRMGSCCFVPTYDCEAVHEMVALSYRSGYERAMKGRPFKIGGNKTRHSEPKKEKTGHWEPVDPENLPNEGTRVRYARECESYSRGGDGECMITLGDEGKFEYGKTIGLPGIHFDDGRFWNWVCFSNNPECLDMWMEDDE